MITCPSSYLADHKFADMKEPVRLGAIDIGSNAVRLLIAEVADDATISDKLKLVRVPLRLGFDAFFQGRISPQKVDQLEKTLTAFRLLMDVYDVAEYRACATSAMRDADNALQIVKRMKERTGVKIDVITGQQEADIIFETHIADRLSESKHYLYIDVGGGSTEVILFADKKRRAMHSFDIGAIRVLNDLVDEKEWNQLRDVLKSLADEDKKMVAIGSGGNINTLYQISRAKPGKPLDFGYIKTKMRELEEMTVDERMRRYGMKRDRADVIIPAMKIFVSAMKWARIHKIYVPKIGLADGLIQRLAEKRV
jgi:exopolyphosphatase/guanosine-5'-triphosphate,3'-diphosphate pyrophosphatase